MPATSTQTLARTVIYAALIIVTAGLTVAMLLLWQNIAERKEEARQLHFRLVELTEDIVDPAEWGKNFPRQYDGYRRTVEDTRHGGSEAPPSRLEKDPLLKLIYAGHPFAVDFREARGHAYMLRDQDVSERTKRFPQPGSCLHCHSTPLQAYRQHGRQAGIGDDRPWEQLIKGFEILSTMPYERARAFVSHPVACVDCHEPRTAQLRVTRPAFLIGIRQLARSQAPVPHLPSIAKWRQEHQAHLQAGRPVPEYDPNMLATRQEMRSFVCAQCHVEYYFRKPDKLLVYPWRAGLQADQIEDYYDRLDGDGFSDWTHAVTGAPLLKAQHPEFEMWSQGIHARSGVACADCHMPYRREGAIKISDHHVRSPLRQINVACQTCHRFPEQELEARARSIQERTLALVSRTEKALAELIEALNSGKQRGADPQTLARASQAHRRAHWRLDFVMSENSDGFHAPHEALRLLAEAIDYARQGQWAIASPSTR
ncbi:MAG: ammonia-forming cytochrome c nitrite reductase subunit c552 [Gemmataceae bacterium]